MSESDGAKTTTSVGEAVGELSGMTMREFREGVAALILLDVLLLTTGAAIAGCIGLLIWAVSAVVGWLP
jgi:hypothetical protein